MDYKTYKDAKDAADKIGGIVYKTNRYTFNVAKGYPDLALKVMIQYVSPRGTPNDQCIYETVPNRQCSYADLDLKLENCLRMGEKLRSDRNNMVIQYIELLR